MISFTFLLIFFGLEYDSMFYDCIFGIANNPQQIIQQCHIDVDCCETTCCDSAWFIFF